MSKYLLDTNVIVDLLRGKSSISESILSKGASISVITLSELYYGANKSNDFNKHLNQVKELVDDLDLNLVDFDENSSEIYGRIKSDLERKGERLEDLDLLIASTAISEGSVLVTNNLKHFNRIKDCSVIPPSSK